MARFTKANEQFLQAGINLLTNKLKPVLVDMNDAGPASGAWVITGVTNVTNPVLATSAAHGLAVNDRVEIFLVTGATGVNGAWRVLSVPDTTHFSIARSAPGAYVSGGFVASLEKEFLSDFALAANNGQINTVSTTPFITSPTVTKGVFDAADMTGANKVPTGDADQIEVVTIVKTADTTGGSDVADTAKRMIYLATPIGQGASGLPLTPTSGGVELLWNALGIFSLNKE